MKKKRLLLIPGALLTLVAVVAGIGALLPKDHVATRRARFRQPPEALWASLTAIDEYPSWRRGLERVERLPDRDGRASWRETGEHGPIAFERVEAVKPSRLVVRIADQDLPFGGTWTYEIAPAEGGGSTVTITENGEVRNVIFRFLSRFVFGHTATLDAFLDDLGRKHGEDVSPEIAPAPSGR